MLINVLVVDDSAFMRRIIVDILNEDKNINVVGIARNGNEALEKIKLFSPDVVTLDIEMPIMNGIDTLEEIIHRNNNISVIMLSSLTIDGADLTLKALDIGAVDFITKPTNIFGIKNDVKKKEIIQKIKMAAKARKMKYATQIVRLKSPPNSSGKYEKKTNNYSMHFSNILAIGTSTGGPKALQRIIPLLPEDMDSTILVVQHMPPNFTKSLAKRLDLLSSINVKEAENGEILKRGFCYIAPGDYHMTVSLDNKRRLVIQNNKETRVSGHRPSYDVLLKSIAGLKNINKIGVILTGMGKDGADGMKLLKESGAYTIAQDENSCIVYGMPKAAVNNGSISKVIPLDEIALEITNKMEV